MRVTFLTAYFAPEITPVTHLYENLAEDLARAGSEVTVIANKASRGLDESTRRAFLLRTDERVRGVRILRVGAGAREGTGLAVRALHFFVNTLAIYRAARRQDTDIYLINSMPPYLGVVGGLLAKRAPSVYILQDIFPDSVLAMGKLRAGGIAARLFARMERFTYRRNTHFVTVSEDMRRTLVKKGLPAGRISVIPNWVDAAQSVPVDRADNPVFDRLGLDRSAFIACYAGTLGILQDPGTLLACAALLKTEQPEIRLVLFGGGTLLDEVKARITREDLHNVRLFPLLPVSEAKLAYSVGDVNLITLKAGVTDIAMPSKTWSALSAARPVVCTAGAGSAWADTLDRTGAAVRVPPGDARQMADAIRSLYQKRDALPAMGARGRAYVMAHLTREASTQAYFSTLTEVLQRGRSDHV